jgi:hypothetical protein
MGDGDARASDGAMDDAVRGARARSVVRCVRDATTTTTTTTTTRRRRDDDDDDDAKRRDATFDEAKRRDDGGARGRGARETVGLTTTRNDAATRADEGDSFAR